MDQIQLVPNSYSVRTLDDDRLLGIIVQHDKKIGEWWQVQLLRSHMDSEWGKQPSAYESAFAIMRTEWKDVNIALDAISILFDEYGIPNDVIIDTSESIIVLDEDDDIEWDDEVIDFEFD